MARAQYLALVRRWQALNFLPTIVIIIPAMSSTLWILRDQRVWPWDEAMYGEGTLRLWRAFQLGPIEWFISMLHALPAASPAIAWVGQVFVPLHHVTGEFEPALLFANVFAAAGTLFLVYVAARRLGAWALSSLSGALVCGGSALFIGLTHLYLGEIIQCFAAASMICVACRADTLSPARTLSLTGIVVALSLLSKPSSVIFVLPMLAYIAVAFWMMPQRARPLFRYTDAPLFISAILIISATAAWYAVNWKFIVQHFVDATVSDITLHWGSPVNLPVKLSFWTGWFVKSLSPYPVISLSILGTIIIAFAISVSRLLKERTEQAAQSLFETGSLFALALVGLIIATLLAFSLQINEDIRFLAPLIPAVGILFAWALKTIPLQAAQLPLFFMVVFNIAINHAYAHGHNPFHIVPHPYLWVVDQDTRDKILPTQAVRSTCRPETANRPNFIVVSYLTLNVNSINFYSEKDKYRFDYRCRYTTTNFMENDIKRALDTIHSEAPAYIVTVAPEKQPPRGSDPSFAPDFWSLAE
jgi:4-amino-4-deoxy-L-arabinose transferase-like glycosyltransferase